MARDAARQRRPDSPGRQVSTRTSRSGRLKMAAHGPGRLPALATARPSERTVIGGTEWEASHQRAPPPQPREDLEVTLGVVEKRRADHQGHLEDKLLVEQLTRKDEQLAKKDEQLLEQLAKKDEQYRDDLHKLLEQLTRKDEQLAKKDEQHRDDLRRKDEQLLEQLAKKDEQLTKKDEQLERLSQQLGSTHVMRTFHGSVQQQPHVASSMPPAAPSAPPAAPSLLQARHTQPDKAKHDQSQAIVMSAPVPRNDWATQLQAGGDEAKAALSAVLESALETLEAVLMQHQVLFYSVANCVDTPNPVAFGSL
eukprot:COSAG05_NODE_4569_length_1457_cov_1.615611_1_plen_309_part_00